MKAGINKLLITLGLASAALLTGCERPPLDAVQTGFRGTAMVEINNPRTQEKLAAENVVPASVAASPDGPKASAVYKNVKVLGNLSEAQFTSFMVAMTSWIAPKEGCGYCHNVQNFADDSVYTKNVSRTMIQMTQAINSNWNAHVKDTGVTCYTCHRGNAIPKEVWFDTAEKKKGGMLGNRNGQNAPSPAVGYASLPNQPFSSYFLAGKDAARITGPTALPTGHVKTIQETESVFAVMIHQSNALGVNCTYCHNTRAFADWEESPPQRAQAWHGIQMVKDVNSNYIVPITSVFPPHRLGPDGDVAKANCATCHQGANKPLLGKSMLKDYPYLVGAPTAKPVTVAQQK
jgi:photosynthetic reaction center cytochrome c subunit